MSRDAVPPRDTRVEMNQIVLPEHSNALGTVFGGQVAAWIDICAAIAAQRFCRKPVVTASIDELHFLHGIQRGHVVVLQAMVNAAWEHSMEVGVRVEGEDPLTGERRHTSSAYLTFVALEGTPPDGNPTAHGRARVPRLVPGTPDEERRVREAEARRAQRLANRARRAR